MESYTRKLYTLWYLVFFVWNINVNYVLTARRDDYEPRIIEHPQNTIVEKGDPATLNCKAEGRPPPVLTWEKDGESMDYLLEDSHQPAEGDDQRSLVSAVSIGDLQQLFFLRVNRPYVGSYQCVATNRLGVKKSKNATLEVAFLRDDFRQEPADTVVVTGDIVVLECLPPRAYPLPTVNWMKDEMMLEPDDRVELLPDGNLMISEVRTEDEGTYICVAINMIGSKESRSAVLTVRAKPRFTTALEDITVAPGDPVTLRCTVEGLPTPMITWTRGVGHELPEDRYEQLEDNSLLIRDVDINDEGTYRCTAQNIWGTSYLDLTLTVSAELSFIDIPADQIVGIGQIASFPCKATGSPTPPIYWIKEGSQDNHFPGTQNGRLMVSEDGTLQLAGVEINDAGHYICEAVGGEGVARARANLKVISSLETPPPIIRYGPSEQTLIAGTLAIIICQTEGSPSPKVSWFKDSSPIAMETGFTVLSSNNLQISDLKKVNSGVYTCIASNGSGETTWSAYLQVIEREQAQIIPVMRAPTADQLPSSPGPITTHNISRTSVTLTWQRPPTNRSPSFDYYRVEYFCHDMGPGWQVLNDTILGERYTIRQLRPESTYMFIVRAVNSEGIGPPSPVSQPIKTVLTGPVSPLSHSERIELETKLDTANVQITNAIGLSGTAITVHWEAQNHQEVIEGYYLKYRTHGEQEYTVEKVMGSYTHIITGLKSNMEYDITIQPFHYTYHGEESEPTLVSTLSDGAPPIGVGGVFENSFIQEKLQTCGIVITAIEAQGSDTLKVIWRVERNEAYIDGYHIKYNQVGSNKDVFQTVTDQKIKSLTGLMPYTEYNVQIQPFKDANVGLLSDPVRGWTGEDTPKASPRQVSASSNGSRTALITWRPPPVSQVHGRVAGYHIFCRGNSTSQHRNKTVMDGSALQAKVTGLMAGKMYNCEVSAFTEAGVGPSSSSVAVYVKLEEVPSITKGGGNKNATWIIAGAVVILIVMLIVLIFLFRYCRNRQMKEPQSCSKSPVNNQEYSKDYTEAQNFQNTQLNSNHTGGQQAAWTDQTWPPHQTAAGENAPPGHIHPGNRGCMTSRSAAYDKTHQSCQYLQPNGGNPAYWLLEAYADPDASQRVGPPPDNYCVSAQDGQRFATLRGTSSFGNQQHQQNYGSPGPEYAVVENDDDECIGPHSCHTLPLQRCPGHMRGDHPGMAPHSMDHCEPYASTTLVLPPNMRGCMGGRNPAVQCSASNSSSSENSGSHTHSTGRRSKRPHNCAENAAYSGSGGSGLQNGVEPDHVCSDCSSMPSDHGIQGDERGSRRKQRHRGSNKQQTARNWTELLPPPPEQPPTDLDSPPGSPHLTHTTPGNCGGMMSSGGQHHIGRPLPEQPKIPMPPVRGVMCNGETPMPPGTIQHYGSLPRVQKNSQMHPLHNGGIPMEQSMGGNAAVMPNGHCAGVGEPMPQQNGNLHSCAGTALSHKVFEDPRHEQLGKELLEFNDDMSQSEMMSDPEEETPMLAHAPPGSGYLPALSEVSDNDIDHGKDDDTDVESNARCTDSMLAAWSTNSSNRDSCCSSSSDGSFYTDADFASAVAAAAESAGMQVVGSTIVDPRNGKKPKTRSKSNHHHSNDPNSQYQQQIPRQHIGNGHVIQNGSPANGQIHHQPTPQQQQQQQQLIQQLHQQQQQQQQMDPSNTESFAKPPYPAVLNSNTPSPGGAKHPQDREGNVSDHVLLQDTNEMGLRVTANPMAFEAEKNGAF